MKEKKKTIFGKLFFKLGSRKRKTFPKSPETLQVAPISEELKKEAEMVRARRAAQIEQQKIKEQYIRHKEMQQRDEAKEDKYSHYMNYQEIQQQLRMHGIRNSAQARPQVQYMPVYQSRPPPPVPASQMNPNWQVMRELDRMTIQRPVRRHGFVVDPQGQPASGYISPSNMVMNNNNAHRSNGIYQTYNPPVAQPTYGHIQHAHHQQQLQMQMQNGHGHGHGYYHEGTYGQIGVSSLFLIVKSDNLLIY